MSRRLSTAHISLLRERRVRQAIQDFNDAQETTKELFEGDGKSFKRQQGI